MFVEPEQPHTPDSTEAPSSSRKHLVDDTTGGVSTVDAPARYTVHTGSLAPPQEEPSSLVRGKITVADLLHGSTCWPS